METLARKLLENAAVQYARQTSVSRLFGVSLFSVYIYLCLIYIGQCSSRNASTIPRVRTDIYIPHKRGWRRREREEKYFALRQKFVYELHASSCSRAVRSIHFVPLTLHYSLRINPSIHGARYRDAGCAAVIGVDRRESAALLAKKHFAPVEEMSLRTTGEIRGPTA